MSESESSIQPKPSSEPSVPAAAAGASAAPEPDIRKPDGKLARMVPYRNPLALLSYYFSVFSLLPVLALVLGPLAVLFGFIGLRRARNNPDSRGKGHAWFGILLGGLMALINWGIVGYCAWSIQYDESETLLRIYREAFDPPPGPRLEDNDPD